MSGFEKRFWRNRIVLLARGSRSKPGRTRATLWYYILHWKDRLSKSRSK